MVAPVSSNTMPALLPPSLLAQYTVLPPEINTSTFAAWAMSPADLNNIAAFAAVLVMSAFKLRVPPWRLTGPAMFKGESTVMVDVLPSRPKVKPVSELPKLYAWVNKVLPKLPAATGSIVTVPLPVNAPGVIGKVLLVNTMPPPVSPVAVAPV